MLLAVDIGNTNIVAAVFDGKALKKVLRFNTTSALFKKNIPIFKKYFIEGAIISSVVPNIEMSIKSEINRSFDIKPYFITADSFYGLLPIKVKNPKEVGSDRLVNAYAARCLYGKPIIIIDFGTATTFCAVDKSGAYLGGAIAPGIMISRDALFEKTAKLPKIDLKIPKRVIGDDTVSAMQSGILYGYAGIVEGLAGRFKKILGKSVKVVATGGLAGIISGETDIINAVNPNLGLLGLNFIWEQIWKTKK